jgi:hypothetical protein
MINLQFLSFFLLMGLSFFNVLPIAHYRAIPLENLIDNAANLSKNGVTFQYKFFSKSDCKKYLGRKQVWDRGFRPIQIQIFNNTDKYLNLCTKNFSFPCIPFNQVADEVYFDTYLRILNWYNVGIGSAGLLFVLGFVLGVPPLCYDVYASKVFQSLLIGLPLASFLQLSLECFKSPKANRNLYTDFCSKAITDQVIEPSSSANGVVFVSKKHFDILKNYLNFNFYLILNDVASNEQFKLSTNN